MPSKPRRLALVKFVPPPTISGKKSPRYPFTKGEAYVFLGEIPNMPTHCVVAEITKGRIYAGYHTDSFKELTDEET